MVWYEDTPQGPRGVGKGLTLCTLLLPCWSPHNPWDFHPAQHGLLGSMLFLKPDMEAVQ